ncbi:MAG: UbiA family prenyltransferase [Verrucomicrobiota bacterium]
MTRLTRQLHALAATARLANLPSVAGNVWLGMALGTLADGVAWGRAALLATSGIGLYLAGSFFNDWADRGWDAAHRPERALPQGLFSARLYLAVAVACGLLGLGAAAAADYRSLPVALLIVMAIVTYTRWHKRSPWAVIPMGLCRALLPGLGFIGILSPAAWRIGGGAPHPGVPAALIASACGLFLHIVGLSLSARRESLEGPPGRALGFARVLFPAAAACLFFASSQCLALPLWPCLLGLLPYALWIALCLTVFRQPVSVHVSNLLAGVPLVDWIVLLPLALATGTPGWAAVCLVLPPLAFLLGTVLQRLAPAT